MEVGQLNIEHRYHTDNRTGGRELRSALAD